MNGNQNIAQGGPSTERFVDLWTQLAKNYATDERVTMGIVNEPHDVNVETWAQVVQAVVAAIRDAGASEQMMLLPETLPYGLKRLLVHDHSQKKGSLTDRHQGMLFTNPALCVSDGSGAALTEEVNLGCSDNDTACKFAGVIFDFHCYFGFDTECSNNGIQNAWTPPLALMRQDPNNALNFMNENSDVYSGWTAWAAGAFTTANAMFLSDDSANDVSFMTQCLAGKAYGGLGTGSSAPGLGVPQGTGSGAGGVSGQGLASNETGTSEGSRILALDVPKPLLLK